MVQFRSGYVSITGKFRENNEDSFAVDPQERFYVVADGMGGQSAGEKASGMAVELLPKKLDELVDFTCEEPDTVVKTIDQAVTYANSKIMAISESDPNCRHMGTTLVFIISAGSKLYIGGIGDSPAFRLRNEQFEKLTTDHSLTQALLDAGTITAEEAETHRYRNVLYRYLGTKEGGNGTHAKAMTPESGDRFLICSDGVTDGIDESALTDFLKAQDDPHAVAQAIVDAAEAGGSKDNITCLVLFVD